MQEQIYDMLLKENEVTWKDIIYDLVKSEQMNPWDVDLSKLTAKYIQTVKDMKEMNYHVSGKVLLASAMLLKIKSQRLVSEDINNFDSFLFHTEDEFEELGDFLPFHEHKVEIPKLGIRTPQARKRKVSVSDLIDKLQQKLMNLFTKKPKTTLSEILPSDKHEDKIYTFMPLLYLHNQKLVNLEQEEHFGEIHIHHYIN